MRAITLDQLDELNIHLMGARALLKVVEISVMEGALDDITNKVLGEALYGVGLLLNAAGDAVNGGEDE
jgi:hypothetical protein